MLPVVRSTAACSPRHHARHKTTAYNNITCHERMLLPGHYDQIHLLVIHAVSNRINSPLWYDQDQMQELAGTTLAAAAAAQQAAVVKTWERLRPAAVHMLQQVSQS